MITKKYRIDFKSHYHGGEWQPWDTFETSEEAFGLFNKNVRKGMDHRVILVTTDTTEEDVTKLAKETTP